MREETRKPNEEALLKYLLQHGKVGEAIPLSVKKMEDLKFQRPRREITRYEVFTPVVATRHKFLKELEKKGVIKLDYENPWKPKIKILKDHL